MTVIDDIHAQTALTIEKGPRLRDAVRRMTLAERGWFIRDQLEMDYVSVSLASAARPERQVYVTTDHEKPGFYGYCLDLTPGGCDDLPTTVEEGKHVSFAELLFAMIRHLNPGEDVERLAASSLAEPSEIPAADPLAITTPKCEAIHQLVARLQLAEWGWVITDCWDDPESIGIATAADEELLVFITAEGGSGSFSYSLETPREPDWISPEHGGDVTAEQLVAIMREHLG